MARSPLSGAELRATKVVPYAVPALRALGRGQGCSRLFKKFHLCLPEHLMSEGIRIAKLFRDERQSKHCGREGRTMASCYLTHTCLSPFYVITCDSGVTGIIDWGFAGWSSYY